MTRVAFHPSALTVCTFGLSERTGRFMEEVFQRQLGGSYVLGEQETADIAIIDLDKQGGRAELDRQLERHPDRVIVLLTSDEAAAGTLNGIVIAKPVDLDHFLHVMKTIAGWVAKDGGGDVLPPARGDVAAPDVAASQALPKTPAGDAGGTRSRQPGAERANAGALAHDTERALASLQPRARHYYLGSQPDVDLAVPEQRAKVFYEPAEFLQGFVQRANRLGIERASVMILSGTRFGSIELYPFARLARASATGAALYAAARAPLGEGDVAIEPAPALPQMPLDREGIEPLDALLWRLALWASRGHLPAGAALDEPVVLKHWPNLSRLLFPPHGTQILALWARRATPLASTASTLGIPQRHVFAAYSACAALDLILADRRAAPRPAAPEAASVPARTLFGALRQRFAPGRGD